MILIFKLLLALSDTSLSSSIYSIFKLIESIVDLSEEFSLLRESISLFKSSFSSSTVLLSLFNFPIMASESSCTFSLPFKMFSVVLSLSFSMIRPPASVPSWSSSFDWALAIDFLALERALTALTA